MGIPSPFWLKRGALQVLHPEVLHGKGVDASCEVAITEAGDLLLHVPGGVFGSSRLERVERDALEVTWEDDRVRIRGRILSEMRVRAVPGSSLAAVLRRIQAGEDPTCAWGPGAGWTRVGHVHGLRLQLPSEPRQPPVAVAVGMSKSTPLLWRHEDGSVWLDDPSEPVLVGAHAIRAVTSSPDGRVRTYHMLQVEGGAWQIGLRLIAAEAHPIDAAQSEAVPRCARASLRGTVAGVAIGAAVAWCEGRNLVLVDAAGKDQAAVSLDSMTHRCGRTWLIHGPRVSLSGALGPEDARWLVFDRPEDTGVLEIDPPVGPAGRAALLDGVLVVAGATEIRIDPESIDPGDITADVQGNDLALTVGSVTIRGPVASVMPLREQVCARAGGHTLARATMEELYRTWQTLRVDRWLWRIYGPIFLTDGALATAEVLPPEPGEAPERHERRKLITESLIVSEQVRAVRLRIGAAPVALPYALLDEEADWLDALTDGHGAAALAPSRTILLDGFRAHLRSATGTLGFALADVERAVARLESVHYPELRGGQTASVLGRVGLGAAMMLLSPISGTITIAQAVVGKLTDSVTADQGAQALLDRFGPQCRSSWSLLVEVTALAALETRSHLAALLRTLAARDRRLYEALDPDGRAQFRERIVEHVRLLRRGAATGVETAGVNTVGDTIGAMHDAMRRGPRDLIDRLTGRGGPGGTTPSAP
jgi:hypothetical protein